MRNLNTRRIILFLFIAIFCLAPTAQTAARGIVQQEAPDGPIYIVQEGDTLWDIAARFRVTMTDLAGANGISDPSQLIVGAQLIIPGLEGVTGLLTTRTIGLGESLRSLGRRYQLPEEILIRLNHMTSPEELYVGASFVLPEQNSSAPLSVRSLVSPGQSLLEIAIAKGTTPWSFVIMNNLAGTWGPVAGDVLHFMDGEPANNQSGQPAALPEAISAVMLEPTRLIQGKVAVIELSSSEGITFTGRLDGRDMQFFPDTEGNYFSLHGIHAMSDPGLYTLEIRGTLTNRANYPSASFAFSQSVLVSSGDYPFDPVLVVSPETIDPAVTKPEDAQWAALTATATPKKMWQGVFTSPAPPPFSDCWPSRFGNRRSYNGSEYSYFHSGLDFCGGVGAEILAPAAGRVVFAGPLTVRGNATIIDHGWGIYTGYLHQSEILVNVGDSVQQGQLIGRVGGTGRVTGPHLHWEVWAGGVQVDPMDWLSQPFPN